MTDSTWSGAATRRRAAGGLSPTAAWLAIVLLVTIVGLYFHGNEGTPANVLFTAAVTLTLVAVVALLTRRLLFAVAAVTAFVAVIAIVASIKRQIVNMVLHAYDMFFYLSSWSTVSFLWSDYRQYLLGFAACLLALGLLGWLLYAADPIRIRRRLAALAALGFAGLTWFGIAAKEERRHMQFYFENLLVSSFYASWGETAETLWRGQLLEAAARGSGQGRAFALPTDCDTGGAKPPHIILIHQESIVPPSIFPQLAFDKGLDPFFQSHDGAMHKLRVETYGGASWLTEFSILAGVSTHAFGGMRQFVQTFMEGKLRDTLPQALARCGYRNTVFYPMLKNFVSNARFYKSVGLDEIFDLRDQGAKRVNERDRFYYGNALAEIGRQVAARPAQPMLAFIQTMAAHWPYDVIYEPDVQVAGGGPGTHPEMHEYLRRLALAHTDYAHLKAELARRFPAERFVIVHYGDHHPMSTRMLLGFDEDIGAEDVMLKPESLGFITYYAVEGVNYRPPALPAHEVVDVPYLGSLILQAAGLPLSDAHRERLRLLALCQGRYNSCTRRDEVMRFHRRLLDSGLVQAR